MRMEVFSLRKLLKSKIYEENITVYENIYTYENGLLTVNEYNSTRGGTKKE